MNKSRGVLILLLVVAAAIGVFLYMRRGSDERTSTPAAEANGSAHRAHAPLREAADPARLVVTVTSDKGPLAGATVRFERERGDVEIVQTGKDGIARADTLEPGTWRVSASAEGHEPAALRERELAAGEVVNIELELVIGGRALTGTVTDASGGPISGARIDAAKLGSMVRPADAIASTVTGADGTYKLTVAEGQLLVAASEPSYSPQSRYIEVGASGVSADFQLVPGGVIEGVVRDEATREPIPGARVRAQRDAPAMMLGERAVHGVATGADGRFRITGLRPGAYELDARATPRASRAATIVGLGVAEQITDVEIIVARAPLLRGNVVDEGGAPVPNIDVHAFTGSGQSGDGTTDAKGRFAIEGLTPGNYMVVARDEQFLPAGVTRIELADKDVDVKVNVRRGLRIKGHVENRQVCDVTLDFEERAMTAGGEMPMLIGSVTTGPDGEFEVGPAQPIAYDITARCPSGEQGTKRVEAKPDMAPVVVEVKPGASIAGKVVDGAGKPMAGVSVIAQHTGGSERTTIVNGMMMSRMQTLTNAAGAYELRGLAAGAYRMRVLDRGRPLPQNTEPRLTLAAVEKKTGVVLTVDRPDGVIRGVVTGEGGKPIADAWVSVHLEWRDMLAEVDRDDQEGPRSRTMVVERTDDGGDTGGMPPALTDAHGRFEIRNLARAPWTVVAEAQAGKLRGRALRVVPDTDIKLQAVGLTGIKGKLIAPGGMPPSFEVALVGPTHAKRTFAAKDGAFSFSRIDPGEYTVSVTSSAGNGTAKVKVAAEQTAPVEVTLSANAIVVGKLIDASGKPLGGVPLTIVADTDTGMTKVELHGMPPTSNPDGTFRLEAKAGPSMLLVMTSPHLTSKRGLNLEAGKTLDVGPITVTANPSP
jgi:protocatechuate 3,4-dioxygenase beta subunit